MASRLGNHWLIESVKNVNTGVCGFLSLDINRIIVTNFSIAICSSPAYVLSDKSKHTCNKRINLTRRPSQNGVSKGITQVL